MACPMIADKSACHSIKGFTNTCNGGARNGSLWYCKLQSLKHDCWVVFEASKKEIKSQKP